MESCVPCVVPRIETVEAADRNLLWLVFTDPYVRELLPHWESDSRRFLAEFRADGGAALGTPSFTDLVDRLRSTSDTFADGWDNRDIEDSPRVSASSGTLSSESCASSTTSWRRPITRT